MGQGEVSALGSLPMHGVAVAVGVAVDVGDDVGVGDGVVPECAQYLPPVSKLLP